MTARALLLTVSLLALAAPAAAQDAARVERLERSVKELRAIVFQGRDTGQPVVVKPAGPDPQVQALEQKVGDLEQTLQRVNGQLDTTTQQLEEARRNLTEQRAAGTATSDQLRALTDRLAKVETQIAPPPPAPTPTPAPSPADPAPAATAAATPPPAPAPAPKPAAPPNEAQSFKAARALLAAGNYPGAATAWQDYTTRFPTSPRLPEARYRLGETYFIQDNHPEAARNYALSLRGWPKVAWASDATLKLAQSLAALNRPTDACAASAEFQTRYGATASAALKARYQALQTRAKCAG